MGDIHKNIIKEKIYKLNRIQLDILLETNKITKEQYKYYMDINNKKLYKEA